jgi:hypothetical protein
MKRKTVSLDLELITGNTEIKSLASTILMILSQLSSWTWNFKL